MGVKGAATRPVNVKSILSVKKSFNQGLLMQLIFTKLKMFNLSVETFSAEVKGVFCGGRSPKFLWHFCGRLITCMLLITNTLPLPVVVILIP